MRALFVIGAATVVGFVISPLVKSDAAVCEPAPRPSLVDKWSKEQLANARLIIKIGSERQVPVEGQVIAVATALQESSLRNLRGGDRDSVGLFQQRTSQGWGTPKQLADPAYQTKKFYNKLLEVDGWREMRLTEAAQAVQVSGHPEAYAKRTGPATRLVEALSDTAACTP